MRKLTWICIIALSKCIEFSCFNQVHAQTPGTNPIFRNKWTADPAPMIYNGTLYVNVGQDSATGSQQFNMLSWLSYSTTDMKNWTYHGPILKPTDFKWGQAGTAWASQMVEVNGKFYYYVTVTGNNPYGGRNIAVAVGNSPTGPFVDARASFGSPLVQDNMTTGGDAWDDIDPTIFIEDDGTPYLCWGHGTCYLVKLKPNMIELAGSIQKITPANGSYTEGPWLHKRNGLYYLTYAAIVNGGSEQINYATSTSINGPFTYKGMLTGNAKNSYTIHPGIIQFKDQWYLFSHNATLTLYGLGGTLGRRSVCLEYLCYNTDGTMKPVTQTTAGVSVASPCPPVVTSILDVNENQFNQVISYPNPFNSELTLVLDGSFTYQVSNMLGHILETGIATDKATFGQAYPSGIYVVKITQNESSKLLKICKE